MAEQLLETDEIPVTGFIDDIRPEDAALSMFYIPQHLPPSDSCRFILSACQCFRNALLSDYPEKLLMTPDQKLFYEQVTDGIYLTCVLYRHRLGQHSSIGEFRRCLCDFHYLKDLYAHADRTLFKKMRPYTVGFMDRLLSERTLDQNFRLLTAFRIYVMNADIC